MKIMPGLYLLCFVSWSAISTHGNIVNFQEQFFYGKPTTESTCYNLIQQVNLPNNVTYAGIPWCRLINEGNLNSVPDLPISNGCTVCHHIKFRKIIPYCKKNDIKTIFTPHAIKYKEYQGIKVLPIAHYPSNGVGPAPKKDILYSFIGARTHPSRKQIAQLPRKNDIIIILRSQYHHWLPIYQRQKDKEQYQNILSRSRFSLCPRGTGPSTVRFWESLQAQAIPIVFHDEFWLPEAGFNWNLAVIRLTENEIPYIDEIIRSISKKDEEELRTNCNLAYQWFCEKNFISPILYYYGLPALSL
jgi:Exostosin family